MHFIWSLICDYVHCVYIYRIHAYLQITPGLNCCIFNPTIIPHLFTKNSKLKKYSDPNNSLWEGLLKKEPQAPSEVSGHSTSLFSRPSDITSPTIITQTSQFTCQGQEPKVTFSLRLTQCSAPPP